MRAVAAVSLVVVVLVAGVAGAISLASTPEQSAPPLPPPPVASAPGTPAPTPSPTPEPTQPAVAPSTPAAPTVVSRALGRPWGGRLVGGVQLPEAGADWQTWDPILKRVPNRPWRRWATAKLIGTLESVLAAFHLAHPELPPVLVGDLSRPHGGIFDRRFGGLGHASHQNGLDADVYYPRADRRLRAAWRPDLIDHALAQELVDRFVAAGAQFVFVGPRTGLRGPRNVVQVLVHHDDHMHVRIRPPRA